ncbi:hypothetical protein EYF80_010369 [Liparis tanakae]|uniref:Uncharacterized protein n=1 Tax=Liparis tanakae TaxID=230148 RepID=A0A4Z2INB3_9TELE|nr:hypothetical protein EYF80_010369 [Liparis tanakae]
MEQDGAYRGGIKVAQCSQVNDSPPGVLVILSQLQQECGSMQVEVTSHFHKDLRKIVCLAASNAAQLLHSLPPVLTEQLHQLHVHVSVSWPRRQLSLEEVKQPVPTRLTLTTQQTLLHRVIVKDKEEGEMAQKGKSRGRAVGEEEEKDIEKA